MRAASVASFSCLIVACSGSAAAFFGDAGSPGPGDASSGSGSGGSSSSGADASGSGADAAPDDVLVPPVDSPVAQDVVGGNCQPTPPDDGACNSLPLPAGEVTVACDTTGTPPAATGGAIVDGTYVMTSAVYYGTTCPPTEVDRTAWLVCGTNWQTVQGFTTNGGPQTLEYLNGTATIASPSVVLNIDCGLPMATAYTIGYDATPTMLRLHIGQGGTPPATRVDTFIRQ